MGDPPVPGVELRGTVSASDIERVRTIVSATGHFAPAEVDVAVELVETRLREGAASGYHFVFAQRGEQVLGYSCYGEIPCTVGSYDLYWIAVDPGEQGRGIGRLLLAETERRVAGLLGRRIYIETSGRRQYDRTRAFYLASGYDLAAELPDFYAPGDPKAIYCKSLGAPPEARPGRIAST